VVIIVGRTPGAIEGLVAAGHSSYLNELLEAAGGRNIFTSATAPYFKVSLEEILARNPDVLLEVADTSHAEGVPRESEATVRRLWARFPVLAAASNGRVFTLASDAYLVPGSRMVDAARGLRRLIYPEAGR
jgi:iron complex transport system substrate-binding protein